jgi:hypothetical protein
LFLLTRDTNATLRRDEGDDLIATLALLIDDDFDDVFNVFHNCIIPQKVSFVKPYFRFFRTILLKVSAATKPRTHAEISKYNIASPLLLLTAI